jgi:peptidoglycan/LPS O-acetylase OafA/YrhL
MTSPEQDHSGHSGRQDPDPHASAAHAYRHEIDGLRALAVLAVIVFHLKASALPGGFWGVDVFFVISGFLITSIILRDLRAGMFSLRAFWLRRARRLLPALLVMVAAVLVAGNALLIQPQRNWLPLDAAAALFSFSNILVHHRVGNYWGELAETLPLLHTWSLSVEEQFYLVLAPLLLVIWRKRRPAPPSMAPVAVLAAASFGGCLWLSRTDPSAAFYGLPTRMWELLAGSLLAFSGRADQRWQRPWLREATVLAGLALILASILWLAGQPGFPGPFPLVPCLGTVLVLLAGGNSRVAAIALTHAPGRYIGRISYSLYLWHWPVIAIQRHAFTGVSPWLLLLPIGLLGAASYHWVESPFRRPGSRWLPLLTIGALTAAAAALIIRLFPINPLSNDRFSDLNSAEARSNGMPWDATQQIQDHGQPVRVGERRPRIVAIYGSSHARMMCPPLVEGFRDHPSVGLLLMGSSGNGVTTETQEGFNARRLAILQQEKPATILVFDKWSWLAAQPGFESALASQLRALAACSPRVLVHSQPPIPLLPPEHDKQLYRYLIVTDQPDPDLPPNPDVPAANARVRKVVESLRLPAVEYIDTYPTLIRQDGDILFKQDGKFLYFDWNHLNERGARLLYTRHIKAVVEALAR